MKAVRILVVDDEEATLFGYKQYLNKLGYDITTAKSLENAKKAVQTDVFDAILLDLRLPDGNSLEWIKEIHDQNDSIAIIVITGVSDIPTAVKAIKYGAQNFLTKPVNLENLDITIKKCLEVNDLRKRANLHQRLTSPKNELTFGSSEIMSKVLHYASVAAENNTVVLLLGETGTGKGVLARWVHDNSSRRNGDYVELNCSSLKGDLLRSELYGHTRGAFTSAVKDREGLIEIADGGSLFLDEIGDMELEVQAELLKTIEEKSFRRIGENKVRKSDFRLICATNKNLTEAAEKGKFRSDLYYRICVFPIMMPALREHTQDIPTLLTNLFKSYGYNGSQIDKKVLDALSRYPWPGNIRELRNMVERAILLAQGQPLAVTHFPGLEDVPVNEMSKQIQWNLDEHIKAHIGKTIKHFNGNKLEASRALGVPLSTLEKRIEILNPIPV